ncbi:hypothetical protein K440DRAFT_665117 [Wilcoxina mikolae CBS 423.85]|nr:hypothetical protein K440DRAFT_665117 [Wilcoxina mikolae CBS 423.85]
MPSPIPTRRYPVPPYPPLTIAVSHLHPPNVNPQLSEERTDRLSILILAALTPLFRYIDPRDHETIVATFIIGSQIVEELISALLQVFPNLIYKPLKKVAKRKQPGVKGDIEEAQKLLQEAREYVVRWIVESEETERDGRLKCVEYVLEQVDGAQKKSLKKLLSLFEAPDGGKLLVWGGRSLRRGEY